MINQDIDKLLSVSESDCLSVIIPTHLFPPEKATDALVLRKSIEKAKNEIARKKMPSELLSKVEELQAEVDFSHVKKGLGIFVSPDVAAIVYFPFPVTERIFAGEYFLNQELLFYKNIPEYYVLSLSRSYLRLYRVRGEDLHEIQDSNFPKIYHETYEYSKSNIATSNGYSRKSFEKDKPDIQAMRAKAFFRSAESVLPAYLDNAMLILCGSAKELSWYHEISASEKYIAGKLTGNYDQLKDLKREVSEFIFEYNDSKDREAVAELRELIGRKEAVRGLREVWKEVQAGNGLRLFINEYIEPSLHLQETPFETDETDRLINAVLGKRGAVTFISKDIMEQLGDVALALRHRID